MESEVILQHLRLDKIIYAVEAGAVNLTCLLVFWIGERYFIGMTKDVLMLSAVVVGVSCTLWMLVGNLIRLRKIRRIEKKIYGSSMDLK